MKRTMFLFLPVWALAQVAAPPAAPALTAPAPQVEVSPDAVIAEVNGIPITAGEVTAFLAILPEQARPRLSTDREQAVRSLALYKVIAAEGYKRGVDKLSPYREQLEVAKTQTIAGGQLTQLPYQQPYSEDDLRAFYEKNKGRFQTLEFRMLKIGFSDNPMPSPDPTKRRPYLEPDAKALAFKVHEQLKSGAKFADLVKQYSDDETSKAKEGKMTPLKGDAQLPEDMKKALFSRKAGEFTEPIRQSNGYYIFLVESNTSQSYDDSKAALKTELIQNMQRDFIEKLRTSLQFKVTNNGYFGKTDAAPAPKQ